MASTAVWNILNRHLFFVKNAVKRSEPKTSDKLDIYDPVSRELLLECREPEIGVLTKTARLLGGRHDRGTAFDFVVKCPGNGQLVLRISRASATLSFGGRPIQIHSHDQELLGTVKKKQFSLGNKFEFRRGAGNSPLILETKSKFLSHTVEWRADGKSVGILSRKVEAPYEEYYQKEGFSYAFRVAEEVPPNDVRRQIFVALAIAQHRVEV